MPGLHPNRAESLPSDVLVPQLPLPRRLPARVSGIVLLDSFRHVGQFATGSQQTIESGNVQGHGQLRFVLVVQESKQLVELALRHGVVLMIMTASTSEC